MVVKPSKWKFDEEWDICIVSNKFLFKTEKINKLMVEIPDRYRNQIIKVNLIRWAIVHTCQVQEPHHI